MSQAKKETVRERQPGREKQTEVGRGNQAKKLRCRESGRGIRRPG